MEIIIEEISKGHKLIGRHKYAQSSVHIGRGYHNDIIVSDPHVCAEHLTIDYDGEHWKINDLNSVNGSFIGQGKQAANGHIVNSGDVISIGNSQIRLIFPNHPVDTSIPFSAFESLINLARHPLVVIASIVLFALATGWLTFLENAKEVNFTQLLVPAIKLTLAFCIWPSIIALISHLTKNDARVLHQIGICFIFFLLLMVTDAIQALTYFNTSSNWPVAWFVNLLPIVLAFCMFWLNCYVGFHMSKARRITAAASLTILFFGGSALLQMSKRPEFNPRPQYNATILPPAYLISSSSSVDDFIKDADKLFEKAQKKANDEK
ncbi:FHA domain-containing protein [Thalassotalea sp. M1531]|uniref:FHA domain-containing protein n=1 Tax=Thalassotalea algicola TaxID=2716224 RepID=A0A7Y0L9J4_9GAMM|nr:FHA domain-containing protein [Thalassotalea algicola]NMP30463.1 FHA domain-containing protein [Thalassotalea algicola]